MSESASNTKVESSSVDAEDEELMKKGPEESRPQNSIIIGKVIERIPSSDVDKGWDHCDGHPCRAQIQVLALAKRGSNYHGQFNENDTIEARFIYTLDPTKEIFPELNEPLPGLYTAEYFEAELFENDRGEYRIQGYDKK